MKIKPDDMVCNSFPYSVKRSHFLFVVSVLSFPF